MQYKIKDLKKYIKFEDAYNMFVCIFVAPFAFIFKIFYRDFWLVCEEKNEARDNGYWLYKWIRENHPEQKIAYAISKTSPDFYKVEKLGKVIEYGSIRHWFWYIVADKNISSQKGGKPNAAVCYFFEVVLKMRKNNRVYLQHGMIKDDLPWLYYKNTNMRMFVTTGNQEHEYICEKFGYPEGYVKQLGMPRYDQLINVEADENLILVMPSWRSWLGRESTENKNIDITKTNYFEKWNSFINDEKLTDILEKYNKKLIFYPHRNMQKFIKYFGSSSDRVVIARQEEYDVQELLKSSSIMITDYSSVSFDFSYMEKPVIFYQFDEEEFRERQYQEGYFDYHNTDLGLWAGTSEETLRYLDRLLNKKINIDFSESRKFFGVKDGNNCKRCYEAIKEL